MACGVHVGRLFKRSVVLLLPVLALSGTAHADVRNVDCDAGGNLQTEINAFSNKTVTNTLNVNGTCSPAPGATFFAVGFSDLTIAGTSIATLQSSSAACGSPASPTLFIRDSPRVTLRNLAITGGSGLLIVDSTVISAAAGGDTSDLTISGSSGSGISVGQVVGGRGSSLTLTESDVIANNCQNGVFVGPAGTLVSQADIHDNGEWGISGSASSHIAVTGGSLHHNGIGGATTNGPGKLLIASVSAPVSIHSNGSNPQGLNAAFSAGVSGIWGANVQIVGAVTIENNVGPGVLLRLNSTGPMGAMTVQSNAGGGMSLQLGSVVDFTSFPGPAMLQGNGGGTFGDLLCDTSSQAFGDVSQVGDNKCKTKVK